jgi:putative transposase
LQIAELTRSAKGTADNPGKNVKQKTGLNREILDTAPARFQRFLDYKAAEAGGLYLEAPTRSLKPSQTCPACGARRKKTLSERLHVCACGHREPRDSASGRVCLNWALQHLSGREPAEAE